MKYVLNHPKFFCKDEQYGWLNGKFVPFTFAFLIGLWRFLIGVILEFMTIYMMTTMQSYMKILLSNLALSTIIRVDHIWATSIKDHQVKKVRYK